MDFTKAYFNIFGLVRNNNIVLHDAFTYHGGLIETYISNESHANETNLKIYIIVTDSDKKTESLKSITMLQNGDQYFIHGYWPEQSFFNVYNTIKTDKKITPFLQYWINRMSKIQLTELGQVDLTNLNTRITKVSQSNKRSAPKNLDLRIYPRSMRRRAWNKRKNERDKIGLEQRIKIQKHFGPEGLALLDDSIFTVTFTDDSLEQKTINLSDLPKL